MCQHPGQSNNNDGSEEEDSSQAHKDVNDKQLCISYAFLINCRFARMQVALDPFDGKCQRNADLMCRHIIADICLTAITSHKSVWCSYTSQSTSLLRHFTFSETHISVLITESLSAVGVGDTRRKMARRDKRIYRWLTFLLPHQHFPTWRTKASPGDRGEKVK